MNTGSSTISVRQPLVECQAETTSLTSLTHVAWRRVIFYLSGDLPTLLHVSSLSSDLQDICRPYITSFFHTIDEPIPPLPETYYYHHLVRLVLEGHLDASSIFEFYYAFQYYADDCHAPPYPAWPHLPENATEAQARNFDRLFRQAVRASPFISSDMESKVCASFYQGNRGAALAVLLPLCTRLKMLEPPVESGICVSVFQSIAHEYQRRDTSAEKIRQHAREAAVRDRGAPQERKCLQSASSDTLPLSELLVLFIGAHQHGYSFPLVEIAPFMGIPSLHRIILQGVLDQTFPGWPATFSKCSCPEIYFQKAAVSRQAVLTFADALDPPCEIRQWYKEPRADVADSIEGDPTWDRVMISRNPDGSKSIDIHFEDQGGNPGWEHAWVSWLARGKMQDWRRLSEVFELDEGDSKLDGYSKSALYVY